MAAITNKLKLASKIESLVIVLCMKQSQVLGIKVAAKIDNRLPATTVKPIRFFL